MAAVRLSNQSVDDKYCKGTVMWALFCVTDMRQNKYLLRRECLMRHCSANGYWPLFLGSRTLQAKVMNALIAG